MWHVSTSRWGSQDKICPASLTFTKQDKTRNSSVSWLSLTLHWRLLSSLKSDYFSSLKSQDLRFGLDLMHRKKNIHNINVFNLFMAEYITTLYAFFLTAKFRHVCMYLFNFLTILEISANLRSASGAKRAELGCVRPTSWCPLMNSHAKRCHTLRPWTSSTAPPGYCTSGSKGQISAGENINVKVSGLNENRQNLQCTKNPSPRNSIFVPAGCPPVSSQWCL